MKLKSLNGKTVIRVAIRAKDKNTTQDFRIKLESNTNFREMNNLLRNKYGMNTVQLTTVMNVEVEYGEGKFLRTFDYLILFIYCVDIVDIFHL